MIYNSTRDTSGKINEDINRKEAETMFRKKTVVKQYDKENKRPVIKCSICNGEQVAGFKDIRTGKFEEIMLIKDSKDLDVFMQLYDVQDISKEY